MQAYPLVLYVYPRSEGAETDGVKYFGNPVGAVGVPVSIGVGS